MSTVEAQIEKKFEIHVKNHPGELLQYIASAWKERRLCDFLIKVGSKEIPVHKIILSEASDYFKAMFSHKMKEVESGVAVMEGVDPECMLICIEYIYTGKVSVPESKIQPLLEVATMLQLTKICGVLGDFFETKLDPESFFLTRKIANTFNLQGLKEHCEKYALKNFISIAVKEGFKDLEMEFVKFLIENKETQAPEGEKCRALVSWGNSDRENRSKIFEEIFQVLEIPNIPATYRHYMAEDEPLVAESAKCLKKLFKATDVGKVAKKDYKIELIAVFDKTSKSIQAFIPELKTWIKMHDLPDSISNKNFFSATVIDEMIYILADDKTNYKLNYTDPDAKWIQLPNRTATNTVMAVALRGEVYAFDDSSNNSEVIEKLNKEQTSWSQMKKPFPCRQASVIAANDRIYTFGGIDPSKLDKVAKFDPDTETWSNLPAMPTTRQGPCSTELNGNIYVFGVASRDDRKMECFNIVSERWTTLDLIFNYTGCYCNAYTLNGKIYAVTGYNGNAYIIEYHLDTNNYTQISYKTGIIYDRATVVLGSQES